MAYLWQLSIVHFEENSLISGTILSGEVKQQKSGYNLFRIPFTYFQKPLANHPVQIKFGTQKFNISTDQNGSFLLECDFSDFDEIKVYSDQKQLIKTQSYPLFFRNSDYPIMVISDIDDTLLVSYTANAWNRIRTILFTSPENRKPVSFTREILTTVQKRQGRIFYVSKSESNLFGLLTSIIQKHKLPEGNLFLTPFLRYSQLLNPKKGKNYKLRSIQKIIDNSPNKKIILIGDDTQQDMLVYAKIAERYPTKILKIYIRKTRKQLLGNKLTYLNRLKKSGVPLLYFSDQDPVQEEIQKVLKLI